MFISDLAARFDVAKHAEILVADLKTPPVVGIMGISDLLATGRLKIYLAAVPASRQSAAVAS